MRVALVHNIFVDQLGLFYVAAALRAAGHDVRYFATSRQLERELVRFDPELVGMTAVTGNHAWAAALTAELRARLPRARFLLGGPHPTYHPAVLVSGGYDFVCRGEGERAVVALAERLARGDAPEGLAGIWWRRPDGTVAASDFAPYEEELDRLPFPDRSLYERLPGRGRQHYPLMIASRGCPWSCSFCYAPTLRELTRGKGRFVRFRSVANVVAEGVALRRRWRVRGVEFVDDIFGMDRRWLRRFAEAWPREVGLPFQCNLRADLVTEETALLLARAGCRLVAFGVESGSTRVRNEVLRKEVADEQLVAAARLLRRLGIRVVTYNILGAPTERWEEAVATLRFNQHLRPDYAWVSVMQPYPGTEVARLARREGLLPVEGEAEFAPSYHDGTPLRLPHRRRIHNLQKLMFVAVRWPWTTRLVLAATRLPENPLFVAVFLWNHLVYYWWRLKRVPGRFVTAVLWNALEVYRRSRSGLYRRILWARPRRVAPTLAERVERGAL